MKISFNNFFTFFCNWRFFLSMRRLWPLTWTKNFFDLVPSQAFSILFQNLFPGWFMIFSLSQFSLWSIHLCLLFSLFFHMFLLWVSFLFRFCWLWIFRRLNLYFRAIIILLINIHILQFIILTYNDFSRLRSLFST